MIINGMLARAVNLCGPESTGKPLLGVVFSVRSLKAVDSWSCYEFLRSCYAAKAIIKKNKARCFDATCVLPGSAWKATLDRAVNKEGCQSLRRRFETEFVGGHDAQRKRGAGNPLLAAAI